MTRSARKRDVLGDSEKLKELKSQVKQLHSKETLDKQEFQCDAQEQFEPYTKPIIELSQNFLEKSNATTTLIEDINKNNLEPLPVVF